MIISKNILGHLLNGLKSSSLAPTHPEGETPFFLVRACYSGKYLKAHVPSLSNDVLSCYSIHLIPVGTERLLFLPLLLYSFLLITLLPL